MKIYEFQLSFPLSLFLNIQLTIFEHHFRKWLGANQAASHYLKQWWLGYWQTYALLSLNELKTFNPIYLYVSVQIEKYGLCIKDTQDHFW